MDNLLVGEAAEVAQEGVPHQHRHIQVYPVEKPIENKQRKRSERGQKLNFREALTVGDYKYGKVQTSLQDKAVQGGDNFPCKEWMGSILSSFRTRNFLSKVVMQ